MYHQPKGRIQHKNKAMGDHTTEETKMQASQVENSSKVPRRRLDLPVAEGEVELFEQAVRAKQARGDLGVVEQEHGRGDLVVLRVRRLQPHTAPQKRHHLIMSIDTRSRMRIGR